MNRKKTIIKVVIACALFFGAIALYFILPGKEEQKVAETENAESFLLRTEEPRYYSKQTLKGFTCDMNYAEMDLEAPSGVEGLTNREAWDMGLAYDYVPDKQAYVVGVKDTDKDGISDNDEINVYHTDPLKMSTAGDLYSDGEKLALGMDLNTKAERDPNQLAPRASFNKAYVECHFDTYDDYYRTNIGDMYFGGNCNCEEFKYEEHGISGCLGIFESSYANGNEMTVNLKPFLDYAKEEGIDVNKKDIVIVVENYDTLEYTTPELKRDGDTVTFAYPSDYHREGSLGPWYMENTMYDYALSPDTVYVCYKEDTGLINSIKGVFDLDKKDKKDKEFTELDEFIDRYKDGSLLNYEGDFVYNGGYLWDQFYKPTLIMTSSGDEAADKAMKEEIVKVLDENYMSETRRRGGLNLTVDDIQMVSRATLEFKKKVNQMLFPDACYCDPYTIEEPNENRKPQFIRYFNYWFDKDSYLKATGAKVDKANFDKEKAIELIKNSCKVTYDDFFPFRNDDHCLGYAWIVANVYNNGSIAPINAHIESHPEYKKLALNNANYYTETDAFATLYDKGLRDIQVTPELQDYFHFVWTYANVVENKTFDYCQINRYKYNTDAHEIYPNTGSVQEYDGNYEVYADSGCYFSKGTTGQGDRVYSWNTVNNVKNYLDQDKMAILCLQLNYNTQDITKADPLYGEPAALRDWLTASSRHAVNVYGYKDITFEGRDYTIFSVYDSNFEEGVNQEYLVTTEEDGTLLWAYIPAASNDYYYCESTPFNYIECDVKNPETGGIERVVFKDDDLMLMSGECMFYTDDLTPLNEYTTIPDGSDTVGDIAASVREHLSVGITPNEYECYIPYITKQNWKDGGWVNEEPDFTGDHQSVPLFTSEEKLREYAREHGDIYHPFVGNHVTRYADMAGTQADMAMYETGVITRLTSNTNNCHNYRVTMGSRKFVNQVIFKGYDISFQAWKNEEMREQAMLYAEGREDEITDWGFLELIKYNFSNPPLK